MTEFLVGLPMIIVLWAGVDYFRQGYARRLETLNQSHAEAWAKAYSNDGIVLSAAPSRGAAGPASNSQMPDGNGDGQGLDDKFDSSMFMYNIARSTKSMATDELALERRRVVVDDDHLQRGGARPTIATCSRRWSTSSSPSCEARAALHGSALAA